MNPAGISSAQICSKPFRLGFRLPPARSSPPSLAFRVLQFRRGIRTSSAWDDKPYEVLSGGRVSYLDEQDIVSFLDPPKDLIPIDPASFNPAAYLWKKLGDIPEERRHRLLSVLNSRFIISRIWEVAGTRYQDAKLAKRTASTLLGLEDNSLALEFWSCRTSEGPFPVAWIKDFKKATFRGKDGATYGRIILGGAIPASLTYLYGPLYFSVRQVREVMSTEQPCDLAYEFGNGLLDLQDFPEGFPVPGKKLGDIPEERRHRLLSVLNSRFIISKDLGSSRNTLTGCKVSQKNCIYLVGPGRQFTSTRILELSNQ